MASGLENEFVTLHEIVKAAKIRLNANIWDYLIGGTETETTLRATAWRSISIAFRPRVLRNVSKIDPSSEILGKKIRLPVMLAPVGSLESFEPGGGITVAKGAGAGNVGDADQLGDDARSSRTSSRAATAPRSTSSMCAATTTGSPSASSRRWVRATTPSASPSTPRSIRGASATSPSAS